MTNTDDLRMPLSYSGRWFPMSSARRFSTPEFLVFLSGSSALLYEVVWQKYLTILLGAQSYSVVCVLGVFLGGLGVGYIVFGRVAHKWPSRVIEGYAFVEVGIGFWGLLFPVFFRFLFEKSPILFSYFGTQSFLFDLLLSISLVFFPSFLMGGTLPLLTQGLSPDVEKASRIHARIYGFNTLGAFLGCVGTTFYLLHKWTLPQTLSLGGTVNIFIGVWAYLRLRHVAVPKVESPLPESSQRNFFDFGCLLGIGLLSGFYLIALQTVLVRLVGLSAGPSPQNFGMVVALFTLFLGWGSLRVGKREAVSWKSLFINQVVVLLGFGIVYLLVPQGPYWHHHLRIIFRDIPENYLFYQLALGCGLGLLLFIPLIAAGSTLPMCFHLLKDRWSNLGLRVGELYSANILGCLLGAWLGGYLLLRVFNLDGVFKVSLLAILGALFLATLGAVRNFEISKAAKKIVFILAIGVCLLPAHDKRRYAQPFRVSTPVSASFQGAKGFADFTFGGGEYVVYRDGPDATIGISRSLKEEKEDSRTVYVNGKSDGNTKGDAFTMNMTGHLPALLSRKLEDVFVVGVGTGITLGALSSYSTIKQVDVAEISTTLLDNIHELDGYTGMISRDRRFSFHGMDAFRFLNGAPRMYDVIISEPSNPWVNGVENLYSQEFYEMSRRHLNRGGILAQWLQGYSFNNDIFRMVLGTLSKIYPVVHVFQLREYDLLLVASDYPFSREDLMGAGRKVAENRLVRQSLENLGVGRLETVLAMETLSPSVSRALGIGSEIHRLDAPKLAHLAGKAFFAKTLVNLDELARGTKEFYQLPFESLLNKWMGAEKISPETFLSAEFTFCEHPLAFNSGLCRQLLMREKLTYPKTKTLAGHRHIITAEEEREIESFLSSDDSPSDIESTQKRFVFFQKNFSPISWFPTDKVLGKLNRCLQTHGFSTKVYGECLLRKAAFLELITVDRASFFSAADDFIEWFGRYPSDAEDHDRLKSARDFLKRLRDIAISSELLP
jgi:spermidine synthase